MSTLWLPLVMLAALVAGTLWLWWRSRQEAAEEPAVSRTPFTPFAPVQAAPADGAAGPPPLAALVLGTIERKAYRLLRESFPRAEVLAHVQLLRFIRLPPRDQREAWMQGTGMLDVDLLLCDGRFRVLAAVDVRTRRDTPAGKKRSERMIRVLEAAGITVHIWHEESLPNVAEIRRTIAPMLAERKAKIKALEAAQMPDTVLLSPDDGPEPAAGAARVPVDLEAGRRGALETTLASTGVGVNPARAPIDLATYKRTAAGGGRLRSS